MAEPPAQLLSIEVERVGQRRSSNSKDVERLQETIAPVFAAMAAAMTNPCALVDPNNLIVASNAAFRSLFGIPIALSDRHPSISLQDLYANSAEALIAEHAATAHDPVDGILSRRAELKSATGGRITADTQHSFISDPCGTPSGWRTVTFVPERGSHDGSAAAQRTKAMDQFAWLASGLAHDLRNVLTVIRADMLALSDCNDPTHRSQYLTSALSGCAFASQMLDSLAAFSRHAPNGRTSIDVAALLHRVVERLSPVMAAKLELDVKLSDAAAVTVMNETSLERAIVNVITNAAEAIVATGVIRVVLHQTHVTPANVVASGQLAAGDYLVIAVTDNGIGMSEVVLARATDPFFTTKPAAPGRGLGLSLACHHLTADGGGVDVVSAPDHGTTVSLWCPVQRPGTTSRGDVNTASD